MKELFMKETSHTQYLLLNYESWLVDASELPTLSHILILAG